MRQNHDVIAAFDQLAAKARDSGEKVTLSTAELTAMATLAGIGVSAVMSEFPNHDSPQPDLVRMAMKKQFSQLCEEEWKTIETIGISMLFPGQRFGDFNLSNPTAGASPE